MRKLVVVFIGVYFFLWALGFAAVPLSTWATQAHAPNDATAPQVLAWTYTFAAVLSLVAAAGLFLCKEWARAIAIGMATFSGLVGFFLLIPVILTPLPSLAGDHTVPVITKSIYVAVFGSIFIVAPVAIIVFLTRPGIKALFAKPVAPQPAAPPSEDV